MADHEKATDLAATLAGGKGLKKYLPLAQAYLELADALRDLGDGNRWGDIRNATGLDEKRCRELESLVAVLFEQQL